MQRLCLHRNQAPGRERGQRPLLPRQQEHGQPAGGEHAAMRCRRLSRAPSPGQPSRGEAPWCSWGEPMCPLEVCRLPRARPQCVQALLGIYWWLDSFTYWSTYGCRVSAGPGRFCVAVQVPALAWRVRQQCPQSRMAGLRLALRPAACASLSKQRLPRNSCPCPALRPPVPAAHRDGPAHGRQIHRVGEALPRKRHVQLDDADRPLGKERKAHVRQLGRLPQANLSGSGPACMPA